jgi:CheY-like chemotaxis protein
MGSLLRRSTGPDVELQFDLPNGLSAAHIDANQVELALLNLVVNSRDAMPDGGRVAISLDEVETGTVHDLEAGRYMRLSVSDSGTGMDANTLQKAVEPFFSTKEVGKGTGLGLSMVHGLARQLKGALRLFSTSGRGTRAELWLPVADGVPTAAAPVPQETTPDEKRTAKLLFVDDDFLIGLATTDLLEDLGHTVIRASSGAEALDILRANKAIDLMITDYAMPGMTGLQLAEQARALRPELPILLATGYADLPALQPGSAASQQALPADAIGRADQGSARLKSHPVVVQEVLLHERQQPAHPLVAQPQPAPQNQAEPEAEQGVREQRMVEPHVARHGAAHQAGQQDCAEQRRARPGIEGRAAQGNDAEQAGKAVARRIAEILQAVGDRLDRHHLDGTVHRQEHDGEAAQDAACPECLLGDHLRPS